MLTAISNGNSVEITTILLWEEITFLSIKEAHPSFRRIAQLHSLVIQVATFFMDRDAMSLVAEN